METLVQHALSACPFLSSLQQREGTAFAHNFALNPTAPASSRNGPVLEEWDEYRMFSSTFNKFHGPMGVVPLKRSSAVSLCPESTVDAPAPAASRSVRSPLANAPLATLSLGGFGNMPDFGKFFRDMQRQNKRKPPSSNRNQHPESHSGRNIHNSAAASTAAGSTSNPASGTPFPIKKALGPMASLIFNPKGHLQCPAPIVKMRAALAATKPVRELRPQALPVKLLAIGALSTVANMPFGMWREHTKKFSAEWIIAVHACIPFIAMLRKAVIMPKYAILLTIATAIAGQAMGARLERKRLSSPRPAKLVAAPPSAAVARLPPSAPAVQEAAAPSTLTWTSRKHQRYMVRIKGRQDANNSVAAPCRQPVILGMPVQEQRMMVAAL